MKHDLKQIEPDDAAAIGALLGSVKSGDYVALTEYFAAAPERDQRIAAIRETIARELHAATTTGYGPRFLHSTGQLHKGGADNGVFLQLTGGGGEELPIPGEPFGFGVLVRAQAIGDFQSLASRKRRAVSIALGARLSRYNLKIEQTADRASCTVDGLAVIAERQVADTHTAIDHLKPHGVSRQLHKCIVGGAAHAVFNGKIFVHPRAQQTDSSQSSRNLLLGAKAQVDTKPQLEIFADDVKCAHGATVGRLDDDALFYLRSRGLTDAAARNLLTYAFGAEVVDRIPVASLRKRLEAALLDQTTR